MSNTPARVALLGIEGDVRSQLRQALLDFGAQISIEADPRAVAPDALSEAGSSIIVVSLDDSIEDALDAFQPVFDDPGVSVIYDDAAVTRKLGGWELARWARHLASKLSGDAAAALPAAPVDAQRLPSFDMRPQPGAPIRPDQEMSAATLSEYTNDTPEMAREVPSLEVPGGGARAAYAPAYVRSDESFADSSLQLNDDEIERAMAGVDSADADLAHAPWQQPDSIEPGLSEDVDLAVYVEDQVSSNLASALDEPAAILSESGGDEPVTLILDDSYLEADFSIEVEAASTEASAEQTSNFAQFGDADDEEIVLDPELLALAAQLDANTADNEEHFENAQPGFAAQSYADDGSDAMANKESAGSSDALGATPENLTGDSQPSEKTSMFGNLSLVSDDDNSPSETVARGHDSVVPQDIDFDALIAGLSLADDDASTVATHLGAVVIFSGPGGPDAVRQVLANLPDDLPVPVVLMQHLEGANHDRLIPQLAKVSSLPVVLAEAGKSIDAGRVFVVPGDLGLSMGRHGNLSFITERQTADVQLAQLVGLGRDLLVVLASGAPVALASQWAACMAAGVTVIAQDPATCFEAAACASAHAAGGRVGAMAELTATAVERWKK